MLWMLDGNSAPCTIICPVSRIRAKARQPPARQDLKLKTEPLPSPSSCSCSSCRLLLAQPTGMPPLTRRRHRDIERTRSAARQLPCDVLLRIFAKLTSDQK